MKKVSLVLGMVLAASFAMAQNASDTKQIGEGNQISVGQTGSGNLVGRVSTSNPTVTYSSQTGDDNHATVTQNGTGNTAFFEQGVSYRNQTSTGGPTLSYDGELFGDGNEITINQTGIKNKTWGQSLGNLNIVSVTQTGNGTATAINSANHWLWGNGNDATQSQTGGIGNTSTVAANTSDNAATINQVGSTNEGYTTQGWIGTSNAWMKDNTATINQTGDRNKVVLADGTEFSPVLPGYTDDLWGFGIIQDGADNQGTVTQNGNDNQAAIFQDGSDNVGTIIQSTDWNIANLIQLGDGNGASITQESGNTNIVNLKQDGDDGEATILQHGTGNKVKGLGLDVMAASFDGSDLNVQQFGTTNILNLQQADGASATVYQNGTSNVATVSQNP